MVKIKNPTEGGRRGLGREEKQPRINDVAYEVVRITQALESSRSSIEPMSAYAALVIEHGRRTQTLHINSSSGEATAPTMHAGALADRIRALRTTASRAAAN